jgi:spermidine synthase
MNEDLTYWYDVYRQSQLVAGDILEVGLGEGYIARLTTPEKRVASFTNYEREPSVITEFERVNPIRDPKHTIVSGDFLLSPTGTTRYDLGIIDIFDGLDDAGYDEAKLVAEELGNRLNGTGKIIVEYVGDFAAENDYRAFMGTLFGQMHTEFINTGRPSTSRHLAYYRI